MEGRPVHFLAAGGPESHGLPLLASVQLIVTASTHDVVGRVVGATLGFLLGT
jgi:hypothetical protein